MPKNILILAIVIVAAYLIGVESTKSRGKNYEDLRHQIERIWSSPDAKKSRHRFAKQAKKSVRRARKHVTG